MRKLYCEGSANYLRLNSDKMFADYENSFSFSGFNHKNFEYIEDFQLLRDDLWTRFVQQFRENADDRDMGWRGEYWGKMMRGACFVYSYTKNPELYKALCNTVLDMISAAGEGGRISSYSVEKELSGWDMWSRKYVLLGMQYFLEICSEPELTKSIIDSMCAQVDYIMTKIGPVEEGKRPITAATRHWRGLNSSSVLEPIVRLYSITGEKRFFDFATYIVNCGGMDVENVFELAYKRELYPYQYPMTKAYEMTSCFEGLLEYYRITGVEKYKTAVINFAEMVLESDFTIIGCAGCTHELFDHSAVRQANTTNGETGQETCVTVTLMKFFYQVALLTKDTKFIDAFEVSFYNAYLGAINTNKVIEPTITQNHPDWHIEPLPFDSYSPLVAGERGRGIGGLKVMSDNHYYGCCACIGAAGIGLVPKMALLTTKSGFTYNLFIDGRITTKTPLGNGIEFITATTYPVGDRVEIKLSMKAAETFSLLIRNPAWSRNTSVSVNGEDYPATEGYISIDRCWSDGDVITVTLDMRARVIYPTPYGSQVLMNKVIWGYNYMVPTFDREDPMAKHHIAVMRGPVVLAQENRLGYSVDTPVSVKVNGDFVDLELVSNHTAPYKCIIEARVPLTNGSYMTVTDYASAGKTMNNESRMAAWWLTE